MHPSGKEAVTVNSGAGSCPMHACAGRAASASPLRHFFFTPSPVHLAARRAVRPGGPWLSKPRWTTGRASQAMRCRCGGRRAKEAGRAAEQVGRLCCQGLTRAHIDAVAQCRQRPSCARLEHRAWLHGRCLAEVASGQARCRVQGWADGLL